MKKRQLKRQKKRSKKLPYIIHAIYSDYGDSMIPTHTHGLYDMDWPEFMVDPRAFGPMSNGHLINAAYDFFRKTKNSIKLKSILNGEIVKLKEKELPGCPTNNGSYIFCFREVTPEFEAVRQAYLADEFGLDHEDMRFVQIWVDGDDFALTDEYYRGGCRW